MIYKIGIGWKGSLTMRKTALLSALSALIVFLCSASILAQDQTTKQANIQAIQVVIFQTSDSGGKAFELLYNYHDIEPLHEIRIHTYTIIKVREFVYCSNDADNISVTISRLKPNTFSLEVSVSKIQDDGSKDFLNLTDFCKLD